jgi:hypothetical protein
MEGLVQLWMELEQLDPVDQQLLLASQNFMLLEAAREVLEDLE